MQIRRLLSKTFPLLIVLSLAVLWIVVSWVPSFANSTEKASATPAMEIAQPPTANMPALLAEMQPSPRPERSLYQRLGGYNAIAAVVDDALPNIIADPELAIFFKGVSTNSKERIRQQVVELVCLATNGPCVYTGRDMKTSHAGLGITANQFNAFAGHLVASLDKFKVRKKEKDELVAIVSSLQSDIVETK
jgi:hemoglobin